MQEFRREGGTDKVELLQKVSAHRGDLRPALLQDVTYKEDGTLASFTPNDDAAKPVITKRIVRDIDNIYYPKEVVVPFAEVVHDRAVQEVFRGCVRGCRFCQAGFIYRPVRARSGRGGQSPGALAVRHHRVRRGIPLLVEHQRLSGAERACSHKCSNGLTASM